MSQGAPWSTEDEEKLVDLFKTYYSLEFISDLLNRTPSAILIRLSYKHLVYFDGKYSAWFRSAEKIVSYSDLKILNTEFHERNG